MAGFCHFLAAQNGQSRPFKDDQRPNHCNAASHKGAAVLAHVARSGRLDAALR